MNRRVFFQTLAAGAIAATFVNFDPERALWVSGKKLISIPRPRLDPRFLVHMRAGKPGCYRIPEGAIRLIIEKLPRYEAALPQVDYGWFSRLRGGSPGGPQAVWVGRHGPSGFFGIEVYPVPNRDTVLAVEYFPTPPSELFRQSAAPRGRSSSVPSYLPVRWSS